MMSFTNNSGSYIIPNGDILMTNEGIISSNDYIMLQNH